MDKLIAMIIGQNCEETIDICLESVKNADKIIFLDGGGNDNTLEIVKNFLNVEIIYNEYKKEDLSANCNQRNFYLQYLKEKYLDWWCIVLDADEVLEDFGIEKLKYFIIKESNNEPVIISPRIHHFIGDLGHEDATKDIHYVPNRIFKIVEKLEYKGQEHPILIGTNKMGRIDIHIWHFRECLGIFNTNKKHLWNWNKSEIHSKEHLLWWYYAMLFGNYPKKQVDYEIIPNIIKRRFGI